MLALGGTAAAANTNSPAVGRALGLIQTHASAVRASANDQFVARDVIVDANGTEHVRFDRTFGGLPVIGGDVVVHSRNGQLLSTSLTQRSTLNVGTRPELRSADAIVAAGSKFGSQFTGTPSAELVIYARGTTPVLAYRVSMHNDDADMTYIVSAKSGKVLDSWSNLETAAATGTGKTIYSGNVALPTNSTSTGFEMRDMAHGGSYTYDCNGCGTNAPAKAGTPFADADNVWGNNTNSDRASAGTDAHFGVSETWNFYASLGRNGIDGTGKQSYNRVHVGKNYVNAFWSDSCFCMSYGDGDGKTYGPLVDLDVAGHEMSHGVTSRTANLTYSGESGGLNEANSDMMGSMVEFFSNNALDTPDYMIGEEIYIANVSGSANQKALRYMFSPNKDGASSDCWYSGVGSLDVHYSSGPANHFFYLLAEGTGAKSFSGVDHTPTTCKAGDTKKGTGSVSLTGIGRDAATRIWYRALTVYETSSTNYAGARVATLNAASDLYGAGSTQYNAVAAAWSAILVN
jgi:Zn-dependent metalloprotease